MGGVLGVYGGAPNLGGGPWGHCYRMGGQPQFGEHPWGLGWGSQGWGGSQIFWGRSLECMGGVPGVFGGGPLDATPA